MTRYDDNPPERKVSKGRTWVVKFLVWLDIQVNDHLLFGKSETLSARMGRSLKSDKPNPLAIIICDFLNIVDKDHCKESYQALLDKEKNNEN